MASQHSFGRSVSTVTDVARGSTGGAKESTVLFWFPGPHEHRRRLGSFCMWCYMTVGLHVKICKVIVCIHVNICNVIVCIHFMISSMIVGLHVIIIQFDSRYLYDHYYLL